MISLILPYWNRWDAACKALLSICKAYRGMELEIVVVDDGSTPRFERPAIAFPEGMTLKIVRLPQKSEAKCPATAWNAGVQAASGDLIALSCVEILHDKPVLQAMADQIEKQGPDTYVLAAAWCPEQGGWHTHSTVSVPECPAGTGIAFLGMMRRELFDRSGGFDEDYREGAGYEDRDFIHRMKWAGAKFVIRDDLVVTHPKTGASIAWADGKFDRNRALFEKKCLKTRKVTVCCVNAGNYCSRGAEYVNALFDMVKRNMPPGVAWRFVCLTDDSKDLDPLIEPLPLPADLEGWYGKLYLFKRGLFEDGERIVYFDLDTVIMGGLNEVISYGGKFATLIDFYYPGRVGPAVMLWEAGDYVSSIWEEWVAEGSPTNPLGDLWWLNRIDQGRFAHRVDKLQKLFPGTFVSYKQSCQPLPPRGAKVVCFHGKPRPHEAEEDWVAMAWKVGGSIPANLEVVGNTSYEQTSKNIRSACARPMPWLPFISTPSEAPVAIVGGGPSLLGMLDELRENAKNGMRIFATNGAHDFLIEQGIVPDAHVIIDARPENTRFITEQAKSYYLASQCAPEVFDRAKGDVTVVHMNTRDVMASIPLNTKPVNLISSGSTVGLAAMAIVYCLGYRKLFVYGMDSSYEETGHAYPQSLNDEDRVVEAIAGGRKFKAAPWMVAQVEHFQALSAELAKADCEISVRCGGLLGHAAWLWVNQEKAA